MINLQMLIQKNTFNVLSSCCPFEKTCSAMSASVSLAWTPLGSCPVKMSQAFHEPSVCFNFLYFHRKVHTFKVIPHNCIAHPFCAYFMASFSAPSCIRTLKTWQICLDIELCQLKNGYSSPTSTGTPPFFQVIVINLS